MLRKNVSAPLLVSVPSLVARKGKSPVVIVTAYDAVQGRIVDGSGADAILVGDSVGMTTLGYDSTVPVTLDDMLRHTRAVARGQRSRIADSESPEPFETERKGRSALLIADLPFGAYGADPAEGVRAGMRLVAEGGAQSVKLEGAGAIIRDTIRRLVDAGVPVMGHLGLTPQSIHRFGGFKAQGKSEAAGNALLAEAHALVESGVWGIVLEMIPATLAQRITEAVPAITIGIGAGTDCDGQVQVFHDLVGLTFGPVFKHTRRYAETGATLAMAMAEHVADVRAKRFPTQDNSL
ncbi:MAG: 3-methyl-2-oxobutanoate hydroxymethyltransferase [Fibrella sp.]|nr:3-methyl-2-oxobutanoate hydroxymethyltransferase [Armatimonadota bacterium]